MSEPTGSVPRVPGYPGGVDVYELERRLADALRRCGGVRFALLFGSALRRGPDAARDIDVAIAFVASPSLFDRARLAYELEDAVGKEVDIVDVDEASTLLRWEIVRSGRVVVDVDHDALIAFLARVPLEWADLQPYYELEAAGLRRALERKA